MGILAAEDASKLISVTEELSTIHCLGYRCLIEGDANNNATVQVSYRKLGDQEWRPGLEFMAVDNDGIREAHGIKENQRLHAGSVVGLKEDTKYEVRLHLTDADGGSEERILKAKTWKEPALPNKAKVMQVKAKGSALEKALKQAKPGMILQLAAGVYEGSFVMPTGAPNMPIVLIGPKDGEAIIDAQGANNAINAQNKKHLMFERLHFRNAKWLVNCNGAAHITIRRCHFSECDYGFVAQKHAHRQERIFIGDCTMKGRATWPREKGIESMRGIQISGRGHVVCHNRISHFADAIDTFSQYPCAGIDFYRNEISECTDDGIELDYSECNNRVFENRLTNIYQGISLQPVHGGPVYVYRNIMYNVVKETFKMHNHSYGAFIFHNNSVKKGMPLIVMTSESNHQMIAKNNLFIGTDGNYGYENTSPMKDCIFEHNAFVGEWKQFLKWNKKRYDTLNDAEKDGVFLHSLVLKENKEFKSKLQAPADPNETFAVSVNDMTLHKKSRLIDRAVRIPNFNDEFSGKEPDIGALEHGTDMPMYGPRPR